MDRPRSAIALDAGTDAAATGAGSDFERTRTYVLVACRGTQHRWVACASTPISRIKSSKWLRDGISPCQVWCTLTMPGRRGERRWGEEALCTALPDIASSRRVRGYESATLRPWRYMYRRQIRNPLASSSGWAQRSFQLGRRRCGTRTQVGAIRSNHGCSGVRRHPCSACSSEADMTILADMNECATISAPVSWRCASRSWPSRAEERAGRTTKAVGDRHPRLTLSSVPRT